MPKILRIKITNIAGFLSKKDLQKEKCKRFTKKNVCDKFIFSRRMSLLIAPIESAKCRNKINWGSQNEKVVYSIY